METEKTMLSPSRGARALFNKMVARSGENLHLPLDRTLELATERVRAGHHDASEIQELQDEEWIDRAEDGGWLLH